MLFVKHCLHLYTMRQDLKTITIYNNILAVVKWPIGIRWVGEL